MTWPVLIADDGPDTNSPQLGSYSGSSIPNDLVGTGDSIYVEFTSDSSVSADGFSAHMGCRGTGVSTQGPCSGHMSVGDGNIGVGSYATNSDCDWAGHCSNGDVPNVHFTSFSTERNFDEVTVCKPSQCTVLTHTSSALSHLTQNHAFALHRRRV